MRRQAMNPYGAGALGGTLATVPMTLVMETLFRRLPRRQRYPLPPREITAALAHRAGGLDRRASDTTLTAASLLAHLGYGALTGALYPLLRRRQPRHPLLHGAAYGVGVWALSYLGWVPAAGILRPASRHPAHRRRLMIAAHLVWGVATAAVLQALTRRRG